jgi:hypothetical protein
VNAYETTRNVLNLCEKRKIIREPDVIQEVPRLVRGDVFRDEELGHDALQVPERPGLVRDQGGVGLLRICRKEPGHWARSGLAIEQVAGEIPFGN